MSFKIIEPRKVKEFWFEWKGVDIEDEEFTEGGRVEVLNIKDNIYLLNITFLDNETELIIEANEVNINIVKQILEQLCRKDESCLEVVEVVER